jgi:hypothetical protein
MAVHIRWPFATHQVKTLLLPNSVAHLSGVGAPVDGVSGTGVGVAGPGSLYSDATTTTAKLYINTNTMASPTWVAVGTQT